MGGARLHYSKAGDKTALLIPGICFRCSWSPNGLKTALFLRGLMYVPRSTPLGMKLKTTNLAGRSSISNVMFYLGSTFFMAFFL